MIGRPTLQEVMRVHQSLSSIEYLKVSADQQTAENEVQTEPTNSVQVQTSIQQDTSTPIPSPDTSPLPSLSQDLMLTAVRNRDLQALERLFGEDYERPIPTEANDICSLLTEAVVTGDSSLVALLLQQNIDINEQTPSLQFYTPLHIGN